MHAATVVDLPDGDPIDCRDLVQAIAGAFVPVPENGASAMACIAGKILHVTAAGSGQETQQADLFGKNSSAPTLFAQSQLDLPEPTVHELYLPMQLTLEEIAWLRSILDDLPNLRWPVSEARRIEFLGAYRRVASDKNWEPNVFTPGEVELRRRRQAPLVDAHWEALQAACSEGSVRIFDRTGIVLKRLHPGLGCFVSRREAKSYLEQRGLALSDDARLSTESPTPHIVPESTLAGDAASSRNAKLTGKEGRRPDLTDQEILQLVEMRIAGQSVATVAKALAFKDDRSVREHMEKARAIEEKYAEYEKDCDCEDPLGRVAQECKIRRAFAEKLIAALRGTRLTPTPNNPFGMGVN
ncbi:hypothetical protein [Burkholderia pseudomallei]|uniref:hypothetical protein n=1 Tax=Burkholderia pseudomallei TaxID=28450 RepID=UPI00130045EB|nr:hypothetical protein [Burkholderia pseudomallei]QGT05894.1 hypothetical protein D286_17225 [Burkholderia pseudomallei]